MTRRSLQKVMAGSAAAILFGGSLGRAAEGAGVARTVEIIAGKDNKFVLADGQKGPLTLKAGEMVHFKIASAFGGEKARDGSVHSFVVRSLREKGWSIRLKEGVQEFTLKAPSAGHYLIECTVECGKGHDDMNMKMVVTK